MMDAYPKTKSLPMRNRFLFAIFCSFSLLACHPNVEAGLFDVPQEREIVVNNRILAKANGKAISVVDVMKKMDMQFYRQFPQYASSQEARFQFYNANWKRTLSDLIDKELIVADSQEGKMNVSAGDVRQEMESLFGPNIIVNLDQAGLTFNEAQEMVHDEIIIRRMMYFRVQAKAIAAATPQKIREFYDQFAKSNIRDSVWDYRVVTIRHRDSTKAAEAANAIRAMLVDDNIGIEEIADKWKKEQEGKPRAATVNVSEEFHTNEKELSESFSATLLSMTPATYSLPITQKSRSDNSTVVRIFYLKNMTPGGPVPFNEVEGKIKDKLINDAMEKETKAYFTRMRQHFDVQDDSLQELFKSDFQPFVLK